MISVTVLAKNSEKYLVEVLQALQPFAEVLVYDTGSTDSTMAIAKQFPYVTLYEGPFIGFGPTHNCASALAKHDWVLSIDSDEILTPEAAREICALNLCLNAVYSLPRHNEFNGKWIRWCGWYPDRQVRLYNRTQTRFSEAQVHESIETKKREVIPLSGAIRHYSYETIADFLIKMQCYSTLFACQYVGKRSSSPWKALAHAFFAFFKSYILKRGILGGYEGFIISAYNGHTAFYKYLKLYEANQKLGDF
jgi:glycosyltransferase involved in cell wall biosynthesis